MDSPDVIDPVIDPLSAAPAGDTVNMHGNARSVNGNARSVNSRHPPPRPGATHKMQRNDAFTSYQKGLDELVIRKYAKKYPPKILPENEKEDYLCIYSMNRSATSRLRLQKS